MPQLLLGEGARLRVKCDDLPTTLTKLQVPIVAQTSEKVPQLALVCARTEAEDTLNLVEARLGGILHDSVLG